MEKRSTQVRSQGFALTLDYRARSYGLKLKHLLHYKNDVEEHAYVLKTNVTTWRSCPGNGMPHEEAYATMRMCLHLTTI